MIISIMAFPTPLSIPIRYYSTFFSLSLSLLLLVVESVSGKSSTPWRCPFEKIVWWNARTKKKKKRNRTNNNNRAHDRWRVRSGSGCRRTNRAWLRDIVSWKIAPPLEQNIFVFLPRRSLKRTGGGGTHTQVKQHDDDGDATTRKRNIIFSFFLFLSRTMEEK